MIHLPDDSAASIQDMNKAPVVALDWPEALPAEPEIQALRRIDDRASGEPDSIRESHVALLDWAQIRAFKRGISGSSAERFIHKHARHSAIGQDGGDRQFPEARTGPYLLNGGFSEYVEIRRIGLAAVLVYEIGSGVYSRNQD